MNYLVDNIIKRSGSKESKEEKILNIEKEKKSKVKNNIFCDIQSEPNDENNSNKD